MVVNASELPWKRDEPRIFLFLKELFKPHGLITHRQHTVESSPCTVSFFITEESRQISHSAAEERRTKRGGPGSPCVGRVSATIIHTQDKPQPRALVLGQNAKFTIQILIRFYKILQIKCGIFISSLCRIK